MSEPAVKRTVVVSNRVGMHARVAVLIAKAAKEFDAKVFFTKDLQRVEATDVLQLLSLGADRGDVLTLETAGTEAVEAADAIEELFLRKFDED